MTNPGAGRNGSRRGALLIAALAGALVATPVLSVLYLFVFREEPNPSDRMAAPASTVTVTVPAPTVRATTPPASASATPPVTTTSTASSSVASAESTTTGVSGPLTVEQVRVFIERGGRGHLAGPDMYQATTHDTAGVVFRWRSIDVSGAEVWKATCQVVSTVTGADGATTVGTAGFQVIPQ